MRNLLLVVLLLLDRESYWTCVRLVVEGSTICSEIVCRRRSRCSPLLLLLWLTHVGGRLCWCVVPYIHQGLAF